LSNKTLTNPALSANSVMSGLRFAGQHTNSSVTGTTNETTLATCTIPANTLGANGILRVMAGYGHTNNANNKTVRVRFGGTAFTTVVTTTAANCQIMSIIYNLNSTSAQGSIPHVGLGTTTAAAVSGSIDTTQNQDIIVTGQLANTGDTITLYAVFVEVIK